MLILKVVQAAVSRPLIKQKTFLLCASAVIGLMGAVTSSATFAQSPLTKQLPPAVMKELKDHGISIKNVSVFVGRAGDSLVPMVALNEHEMRQPASVMKVVTTSSALDLLGPSFRWETPVWTSGTVQDGVLNGNLYIGAEGDPSMKLGQLYELLAKVRSSGIKTIQGDVIIDRSSFDIAKTDPGAFDDAPYEPYNVAPNALTLNFNTISFNFTPTSSAHVFNVGMMPPLAGVSYPTQFKVLSNKAEQDASFRALTPEFSNPLNLEFTSLTGNDALSSGEQSNVGALDLSAKNKIKTWTLAYPDPSAFAALALSGVWQQMGGVLQGTAKDGVIPPEIRASVPLFRFESDTLTQVIYDINKFSNNLMAKELFLALGRVKNLPDGTPELKNPATWEASRVQLLQWWKKNLVGVDEPILDNGSGLSRTSRVSAFALASVLAHDWNSNHMPEFMSSLPIYGVDGTLRRVKTAFVGRAHMKTGTLKNVVALAGYVKDQKGQWHIVVGMVNDDRAELARDALHRLVDWVAAQP